MKAIISDIHGNLTALDAVLADIKTLEIEEIICLGDVVGYGPRPRECMERLAECDPILLGNHEEAVLDADAAAAFNDRARRAVEWIRKQLFESVNGEDEETVLARRRRLESFQRGIQENGIQYVHASPRDPTREYITPRDAANPVKMAGGIDRPSPAPRLGQHTDEILADVLAYDTERVAALREEGVVA